MSTQDTDKTLQLVESTDSALELLECHLNLANKCLEHNIVDNLREKLQNYTEIMQLLCSSLNLYKGYLQQGTIHPNCVQYFIGLTQNIQANLPYRNHVNSQRNLTVGNIDNASSYGNALTSNIKTIEDNHEKLTFSAYFFEKLGFFEGNITAIGANGSGKSSIVTKLKESLQNEGVVIPAQKILHIQQNNSINNPSSTANELKTFQSMDKSSRAGNIHQTQKEFGAVINNLLSENNTINNTYRLEASHKANADEVIHAPPVSNLDKAINIWNGLIDHRTMECIDGFNITLRDGDNTPYPANLASDGEKVLLYVVGHVLQAPENGFIVIDEPEMYLNKAILSKIWDRLEKEKPDCVFVYLTHDIEFATNRKDSKKLWIKSFNHPDTWDIEEIPNNIIPENLVMELLGSRKNIMFCEGKISSNDEKVLNILFPNLTIKPVESCENVINYTKALNKLDSLQVTAIGLIDSDHHSLGRLNSLEEELIYNFSVSEIENLLLDEELLTKLSERLMCNADSVDNIKTRIIETFNNDIELQASNYVSAYIDYIYKSTNFKKGNKLADLHQNLDDFNSQININELHGNRVTELNELTSTNNYNEIIKVYNNKGLKRCANLALCITDFTERMIQLLKENEDNSAFISRYFPLHVIEANNT